MGEDGSSTDEQPVKERMTFRPDPDVSRGLWAVYPPEDYPSLNTLQDRYERAAEDIWYQHRNGGPPDEIFEGLRTAAEQRDGVLALILSQDGQALVQVDDAGGLKLATQKQDYHIGPPDEQMIFDDLDDEELREQTATIDSDDVIDLVFRLTRVREDMDLTDGLERVIRRAVAAERVDLDRLRAVLNEVDEDEE